MAPMIMGMAASKVMEPDATSATTSDVVVELLCNMAVISSPMNNPVNGLAVASKIVSAKFCPACCREAVISSMANKKRTKAPKM